tara:strand:+ start:286 stop:996 length:711 start_codon:yes stop_codon:yes gene_type:complete
MYKPIGTQVEKMFSGIAIKYDFLNHLLSFGMDYLWRHRLVSNVARLKPRNILDLATGSGDVAFSLSKKIKSKTPIMAQDFCEPMLEIARSKQSHIKDSENIKFEFGDCMELAIPDNAYDAITIAFGVRNFEERLKGFKEMHRVLKPDGSLFVLEFSQPYNWFRPFYYLYLKFVLPTIAGLVTQDKEAYKYLAGTIESFPTRALLKQQLLDAGFDSVKITSLTFSTVAIHQAIKAKI